MGPLFVPIVMVGAVMFLLLAGSRWLHKETGELKQADPLVALGNPPLADDSCVKPEVNGNTVQNHTETDEPIKKKKKKKSCCGTKGSCCKTKKETVICVIKFC